MNLKPRANFCGQAAAFALSLIVVLAASAGDKKQPRLRVSENRRFPVTADGKPFFWLGDTAWELFHRPRTNVPGEDWVLVLDDAAKSYPSHTNQP